jgi:hypothetical protein
MRDKNALFECPYIKIGELMDEFEGLYFQAKDAWLDEKSAIMPVCCLMHDALAKLIEATDIMVEEIKESHALIPKGIAKKKPANASKSADKKLKSCLNGKILKSRKELTV